MASDILHLRSSYSHPSHPGGDDAVSSNPRHRVIVRHPGYDDVNNILFLFQASDHSRGGLHHETARIACAIIADNRWDGYLSMTRDGTAIDIQENGLLPCGNYYFQVPAMNSDTHASFTPFCYHIIPRFRDWRFPHDNLPLSWTSGSLENLTTEASMPQRSMTSGAIYARDVTCRLSDSGESTEMAHFIPRSEDEWFHHNLMHQYVPNVTRSAITAIDDPSNILLLREDLHTIFDARRIVFVPKTNSQGLSHVTTHVLASSNELIRLYHNVPLLALKDIAIEFLFARFAWSIFPLVDNFLQVGAERLLRRYLHQRTDTHIFSGPECRHITKIALRSGSESPKKRNHDATTEEPLEDQATNKKRPAPEQCFLLETGITSVRPFPPKRQRMSRTCRTRIQSDTFPIPIADDSSLPRDAPSSQDVAVEPAQLRQIARTYLYEERKRSDPNHACQREQKWARKAMRRPLCSEEVRRVYRAMGVDVIDD